MSDPAQSAAAAPAFSFHDVITELETVAGEVITKVEEAGREIIQEVVPVIETTFVQVLKEWGQLGIQTVTDLMTGEAAALSGGAKANLAATTIVDAAAQKGVALAAPHVSALVEFSLTAVRNKLHQLATEAAAAV